MKRKDMVLIAVIVFIAVSVFIIRNQLLDKDVGKTVVVYKDSKIYGSYPLQTKETILIGGTNTLVIEDGMATMIEADCPDKLCVHQKSINRAGETIVCLPNKIVVEIKGGSLKTELDAVVQ